MPKTLVRWLAIALVLSSNATWARTATPPPPGKGQGPSSGVWYEIFVRSWYDSNGDGVGDLNGVTAKLDYLKSLGVDGIWLMPINPSPSYHGYDVTDYEAVNPQYGTLADFDALTRAAHARGMKVILDLVINHTSDRHPWFETAHDPRDPHHAWYNWAGKGTDLTAASAAGGAAWHALGAQHYLGDFGAQMPDLDYDTPAVRARMIGVGRFWLAHGADGFRLDAAQHVYYDFASQANDPTVLRKNLAWWSTFHRAMAQARPDVYLVGEVVRDQPQQLVPWFGPLNAVFDFPLASQLIDSARQERVGALGPLLKRLASTIPTGHDAPFLSNHDQERVMSQLGGNAQHMRVAAAMLLTLPGRTFLYYGEELGTRGRKPDPDLREPMRWHRDPHATGESRWKVFSTPDGPQVSVDAEEDEPSSLLSWYRTLIGWRRELGVLRDGALQAPPVANPYLAAWELSDSGGRVLVVHNLAGTPQTLELTGSLARFTRVRLASPADLRLVEGRLRLPAYASVIVE